MRRLSILAVLAVALTSCGGEGSDPPPRYPERTSPAAALSNLEMAYQHHDRDAYSSLLADDFSFRPDDLTQERFHLADFWLRDTDLSATGNLFESPVLRQINILLPHGPDQPVNQEGREKWRLIHVGDTLVEVIERWADQSEDYVFRIEDDAQWFYFRQGKSPADTLESSPTSGLWYLVEWRDEGISKSGAVGGEFRATDSPVPVDMLSWSALKAKHLNQ